MKISGVGSGTTAPAKRTEKGRGAGGTFSRHLGPLDDNGPTAVDAPVTLAGIESILAMQSVDPDAGGGARKRMIQRGEELLDHLEELRQGVLDGKVSKDSLTSLAHLARTRRESGVDPQLAAVLDEIELRAEVELAKLNRR
ncbi:flagellar assembly protein FliX [Novispirillum itersonii]|uniref:flagellar assembly protein FliX n=1 Tax=Novispirillum itersonii TaxID=189 RepID=UPI001612BBF0|nr:flagellar assembly protein FliX [Novispirillum itersonii]